jgi:hypothetical protein
LPFTNDLIAQSVAAARHERVPLAMAAMTPAVHLLIVLAHHGGDVVPVIAAVVGRIERIGGHVDETGKPLTQLAYMSSRQTGQCRRSPADIAGLARPEVTLAARRPAELDLDLKHGRRCTTLGKPGWSGGHSLRDRCNRGYPRPQFAEPPQDPH